MRFSVGSYLSIHSHGLFQNVKCQHCHVSCPPVFSTCFSQSISDHSCWLLTVPIFGPIIFCWNFPKAVPLGSQCFEFGILQHLLQNQMCSSSQSGAIPGLNTEIKNLAVPHELLTTTILNYTAGVSERQLGEAENSRQTQDENGVFSLIHWLKVSHRGCWFNQNQIPMQRRTDPSSEMPFLLSFPTVTLPLAAFDVFLNSHPTSKCGVILRTENRRPKRKSRQDTKLKVGCQWRGRPEKPEPRR